MPIYIRPAREQAEHDRLISFLESQHKSEFEVLTNRGDARDFGLKVGGGTYFPDLILLKAKKLAGVIEIETGESTNNLEALAQWVHFGKARVPFHLYVPELMLDAARRFSALNQIAITEIWTYRVLMQGFDLVLAHHDPQAVSRGGKGAAAKVVEMPKVEQAPRPEPVAELIEEVVRLRIKGLARKEAQRPSRPSKAAAAAAAAPAAEAGGKEAGGKGRKAAKGANAEPAAAPVSDKPGKPAKAVAGKVQKPVVKKPDAAGPKREKKPVRTAKPVSRKAARKVAPKGVKKVAKTVVSSRKKSVKAVKPLKKAARKAAKSAVKAGAGKAGKAGKVQPARKAAAKVIRKAARKK